MVTKRTTLAASLIATLLFGCGEATVEHSQEELITRATSAGPSWRISMNGLDRHSLALLSTDALGGEWLSANQVELNPAVDLARTEEGRALLSYVARCALPGDVAVIVAGDDLHVFRGQFGLAPEWLDESLSPSGQRWVSACLLAHVNALGEHVAISLRGPHPNLEDVSSAERARFSVQEAAFYGNLFRLRSISGSTTFACEGGDIYLGHGDSSYLSLRLCGDAGEVGDETACGFTYTGACAPFAKDEDKRWACQGSNGPFKGFFDCLEAPISNNGPTDAVPYVEVITVFLENTGWDGGNGLLADLAEIEGN